MVIVHVFFTMGFSSFVGVTSVLPQLFNSLQLLLLTPQFLLLTSRLPLFVFLDPTLLFVSFTLFISAPLKNSHVKHLSVVLKSPVLALLASDLLVESLSVLLD